MSTEPGSGDDARDSAGDGDQATPSSRHPKVPGGHDPVVQYLEYRRQRRKSYGQALLGCVVLIVIVFVLSLVAAGHY